MLRQVVVDEQVQEYWPLWSWSCTQLAPPQSLPHEPQLAPLLRATQDWLQQYLVDSQVVPFATVRSQLPGSSRWLGVQVPPTQA